jgi:ADA HAT complex component 1
MLRLLSWSSGLAADKIPPQEIKYLAKQPRRSPATELQRPPILKRKRVSSDQDDLSQSSIKRRMEQISHVFVPTDPLPNKGSSPASALITSRRPAPAVADTHLLDQVKMEKAHPNADRSANAQMKPDKEILRQTLDSQISLEILLKHNELRLIDQEIAKCQIALEQLRRCTEIPYPINRPSESVSHGQGPALRSSKPAVLPGSPSPWGVADGPYTRHYAKWLLPDPLFDGGDRPGKAGLKTPAGKTPTKGRTTRGSFADPSNAPGPSKAQRAGKFQALSSGYPQPKDKAGPMIQNRKSDGLLVKLVCLDCRRDNFSSAQGFINHCRIAHGRNFASHDAAADACGEPVDVDEAGAVIGGEGPPSASMAALVNPLIYSAHLLKEHSPKRATGSESNSRQNSRRSVALPPKNHIATISEQWPNSHLTPSVFTPNLSTLMQRQGATLDLQSLVADMKTSVPVDEISDSEGEEDEDNVMPEAPPIGRHPHLTGSMQPARSSASEQSDAPSLGRKGLNNSRIPQTAASESSLPPAPAPSTRIVPSAYVPSHSDGLERSPTNDSTQAPSLVDDDGDEEYEAHSPSYSASGSVDTENRDLDFEVEDGDESGPSTRNRSTDSDYSSTPKQPPPPPATRRASALRRSISGREEKHVSFLSPSPAREAQPTKPAGDRKRKRTGSG